MSVALLATHTRALSRSTDSDSIDISNRAPHMNRERDCHFPFPHEVLIQVFSKLSHEDMVALSCTDRRFREIMRPYIFECVTLNWEFILSKYPEYLQQPRKRSSEGVEQGPKTRGMKNEIVCPMKVKKYVEQIRIIDANIQNEWNFKFDRFVCEFKNIRHLSLMTQGSSNFLKYNGTMPQVQSLELLTGSDGTFNLNHCKPFPALKKLTIKGFMLDFDEEDIEDLNIHVKTLNLINCSWNYPFQLKFFGSAIRTLSLEYHDHQFILSERFREFLHNPNLPQLEFLTISNQNWLKLHITYQIMNFLQNIPALKKLYLLGNIYNETINNFTTHDVDNAIRYIMNVNDVKIFYSSFIRPL